MPLIDYRNVELHRNDIIALREVNFTADEGQLIYLTGKVGSGKSSFLKSIYGEIPIASGSAEVLGRDMTALRRSQIPMLRREIGIIFQDFRLLPDRSVFDNLDFVLRATGWTDRADRAERIEQVLREMGLLNKGYKMPHALSGGEQQRVVIARAILNSPKLILADEPTGNLDPSTGSIIIRRLNEIAQSGTAVIVATHNHELIRRFPARTFVCAGRRMAETQPSDADSETEKLENIGRKQGGQQSVEDQS